MRINTLAVIAKLLLLPLVAESACAADGQAMRLAWKDNILTISGPDLPGHELKILYMEAYCRPGSTNRKWPDTTIGHKTRVVSQAEDGHSLLLECTLTDGVKVTHQITAKSDEIDFQITA